METDCPAPVYEAAFGAFKGLEIQPSKSLYLFLKSDPFLRSNSPRNQLGKLLFPAFVSEDVVMFFV
ncbi:hypothetical protein SAMN05216308_103191 [Nitrosospira sp. Nsp13]|jgi:hypothetical protein|nr:hypothetical protein SAMN05216308_103191 [Nitrosospira sp. Nsp13]